MRRVRLVIFIWERLLQRGDGWLFVLGWHQRSAYKLDAAGAPLWLIRARCPGLKGWGSILYTLARPSVGDMEESDGRE